MYSFYYVTEILLDRIKEFINSLFSATSILLSGVGLIFCIVIIVNALTRSINKKFFINNRKFMIATLVIELISSIVATDILVIKINICIIIICLFIFIYKANKQKPKRKVIEEVIDNDESI